MVRRGLTVFAVVAATVAFAACGSSGSSKASSSNKGSSGTTTPSTAAPASSPSVVLTSTKLGQVLAAPDGKILYLFTKDQGTTTACTGGCVGTWPALKATGTPVAGPGLDASKLTAANGQVAYNGHLLYFFAGDTSPGQTNGQGIGGIWYVVNAAGDAVKS